jgi:hypothetical protein
VAHSKLNTLQQQIARPQLITTPSHTTAHSQNKLAPVYAASRSCLVVEGETLQAPGLESVHSRQQLSYNHAKETHHGKPAISSSSSSMSQQMPELGGQNVAYMLASSSGHQCFLEATHNCNDSLNHAGRLPGMCAVRNCLPAVPVLSLGGPVEPSKVVGKGLLAGPAPAGKKGK